jgi:hypothetical protein
MTTLDFVLKKFNLNKDTQFPVKLIFKRYDMAGMFKELGFKTGAEIGVYKGGFSEILCVQNTGLKLYCIDPWKVYDSEEPEPYAHNREALEGFYQEAVERLSKYNCEIIRKTSMEAIKDFKPESLDFVYIDANHSYKNMKEDIEGWSKIVHKGGIVSGHDYGHFKHKDRNLGTKRAIDEYITEHNKKLFLVNRNYQTTWFFVN